jgi:hypothetical protein
MDIRKKENIRGLRDIRTRSGRVDRDDVPYMAYMKIGSLEMEKARREKEKSSAEFRIKNISMRLAEIEAEKDATLKSLGERKQEVLQALRKRGAKSQDVATQRPCSNDSHFKIRY